MNETHDCRECRKHGTDYDCRGNCEGRDMFEPIEKKEKELIAQIVIDKDELSKLVDKAKAEILAEYNARFKAELEDIKAEILKEMENLKGNSGCNYFSNRTIDNCIGTAAEILDKRIKENKQN